MSFENELVLLHLISDSIYRILTDYIIDFYRFVFCDTMKWYSASTDQHAICTVC